jgi:hypothetical protein
MLVHRDSEVLNGDPRSHRLLNRFGHAMTMTLRRHMLVTGERDRLARTEPCDDRGDGKALPGKQVLPVAVEQRIVVRLCIQAPTFL